MHLGIPHLGLNAIGSLFGPASLFAGGAQGVWYDPSDFTSLYQDSAGTTPVTAFEQPVGLMLDKSQGMARGANVALPFNATNWTVTGADGTHIVTFSNGTMHYQSDTTTPVLQAQQIGGTVSGQWYEITAICSAWTSGSLKMDVATASGGSIVLAAGVGTVRAIVQASGNSLNLYRNSTNVDLTLSSLTVRQVSGNHASQATTTQRPVVSARYNLLAPSEDVSTWSKIGAGVGSVPTVTQNYAVGPSGRLNATRVQAAMNGGTTSTDQSNVQVSVSGQTAGVPFRGRIAVMATDLTQVGKVILFRHAAGNTYQLITLTNSWQIVTRDETSVSTSVTLMVGLRGASGGSSDSADFLVTECDLRTVSDAALSIPGYQQVTSATVYATAGFPAYLKFDGVDDGLATGNIDFTGTSKMTVFAGVTKLSDAAAGAIVELSAIANTTPGSFVLLAPGGALPTTGQYVHGATGLNTISSTPNDKAAPASYVHTGLFDLSQASPAAQNVERLNGVAYASPNADAGGGNFSLNPIYIGRRFNTSTALNGRLYGLIAVGAGEPANTITFTERWMGQKEGIGGL